MHNKTEDTEKVLHKLEISLKWILFWQYRQGQYLELNQKSMVELFFAKIVNDF